jgi:hypothetical protein
MSDHLRRTGK